MDDSSVNALYDLLDSMVVTSENEEIITQVREDLQEGNYIEAMQKLQMISQTSEEDEEELEDEEEEVQENTETNAIYPEELSGKELEHLYIGMLLANPKLITKYYFLFKECYFEDEMALNNYKSVLFTEASKFTPEKAKQGFNFAKETKETRDLKAEWKEEAISQKQSMEQIYIDLKKLFILRKAYMENPIGELQEKIVEITSYILYHQMSIEEVESAIKQVNDTGKFKRAVITEGLSEFLKEGENNLTNGLDLPFPILSSVFKGIRKGETMAVAMPSNSGKSRFTTYLAAYTALAHKKKVLIISNEMSEEKMKLCLITTVINNPKMQKLHGQDLRITEGELLELKFRPDNPKDVKIDEEGYILRKENESQVDFTTRLKKYSSDFNKVLIVTDWISKQMNNSIYFINITEHTDEELSKVVKNYYYKEHLEYIFYDTLKADTAHIGNSDAVKRTATILSNLAQDFNIFIGSTMQLIENSTLPVNLTINDLSSRTVKEVLDTLCLLKQIYSDSYHLYEYSLNEVDTKFFDLQEYEDPNVRYYACVVDKNRAGSKPTLLFRLNLAYNEWEELGYLRLKQPQD